MSNAEKLADEFEKGETDIEKVGKGTGKRTKAEQHEHKHSHPEGDTRKIVNYCVSGQDKRKGTAGSTPKKD
ncbi:hypothetical protein X798_05983 [Onchocerca flexuosa]|uniref:Uncharacterized protein n=1 Tax=Onchocerca flexuosa TaxID=387005 RepID=A0A238BNP9_9BILA|nr:hypothetical protein X798_05983 [Onchocerca flexuosa]